MISQSLKFTLHAIFLMKNDLLHQNKGINQKQRRPGIQGTGDPTKEVYERSPGKLLCTRNEKQPVHTGADQKWIKS